MNESEIIELAEKYLVDTEISFVRPGRIGNRMNESFEIIFLVPEALEPDAVIDPPDVRVKVNLTTKDVSLVEQM